MINFVTNFPPGPSQLSSSYGSGYAYGGPEPQRYAAGGGAAGGGTSAAPAAWRNANNNALSGVTNGPTPGVSNGVLPDPPTKQDPPKKSESYGLLQWLYQRARSNESKSPTEQPVSLTTPQDHAPTTQQT